MIWPPPKRWKALTLCLWRCMDITSISFDWLQWRRHGCLSGRGRIVGSVATGQPTPKYSKKSERMPELGHLILESGGRSLLAFSLRGTRSPRPPLPTPLTVWPLPKHHLALPKHYLPPPPQKILQDPPLWRFSVAPHTYSVVWASVK